MSRQQTTIDTSHFTDAEFMTADEKRRVLKAWIRFINSRFEFRFFTKALYNHLIQHTSMIAHYSKSGFFAHYFQNPEDTQRFLDQFDRSKGCVSVEYGNDWIQGGNDVCAQYYDINNAMVNVLEPYLPDLRQTLRAKELENAQVELVAAQARVNTMMAQG